MKTVILLTLCLLVGGLVAAPGAAANDPGPKPGCWWTYTEIALQPDPLGIGTIQVPTGFECGY